ncbi:MAG: hypothetical protein KDA49_07700, partial [Rhodospirillaceae bacterium]|nr:hypothetical protein [Rhodospirillaceae bacterium]
GAVHQIENRARVGLHLIEVQCGGYLGEDDVVLLDEADRAAGGLPDFARAAE